jgi:hypothetical protein
MAMHDCQVFLPHGSTFPKSSQVERSPWGLGHDHNSTGFPIEPVYQVGRCFLSEVQANSTYQTGINIPLRWVTNQAGRLIDGKQLGVLKNDLK